MAEFAVSDRGAVRVLTIDGETRMNVLSRAFIQSGQNGGIAHTLKSLKFAAAPQANCFAGKGTPVNRAVWCARIGCG